MKKYLMFGCLLSYVQVWKWGEEKIGCWIVRKIGALYTGPENQVPLK
jgi:hypothetical protein